MCLSCKKLFTKSPKKTCRVRTSVLEYFNCPLFIFHRPNTFVCYNPPMPAPIFPLPSRLEPTASAAAQLLNNEKYHETITLCEQELAALEKQNSPARPGRAKPPSAQESASPDHHYYALTLILVDALAALGEWKTAKEVLGKYRVRFPRDPWGFRAGAEVTRRDPVVKDRSAVQRAIELLEGEAERLQTLT